MKYYSELLNKLFDTREELETAEKNSRVRKAEESKKLQEKEASAANRKRLSVLQKRAVDADRELQIAKNELEKAHETAKELREKTDLQIKALLDGAKNDYQDALAKKNKAFEAWYLADTESTTYSEEDLDKLVSFFLDFFD